MPVHARATQKPWQLADVVTLPEPVALAWTMKIVCGPWVNQAAFSTPRPVLLHLLRTRCGALGQHRDDGAAKDEFAKEESQQELLLRGLKS